MSFHETIHFLERTVPTDANRGLVATADEVTSTYTPIQSFNNQAPSQWQQHTSQIIQIAANKPARASPSPRPLSTFSFRTPAFPEDEADAEADAEPEAEAALALAPEAEDELPSAVVVAELPLPDRAVDDEPAVAEPVTGVLCAPGAQEAL